MDRWRRLDRERLQQTRILNLDRVRYEPPGGHGPRDYYLLDVPHWINVIPITSDRRVVMVSQYRVGIDRVTLEIPGGMCEPNELPTAAARRELIEETGYEPGELIGLGSVHPNPAIQNNTCHHFLALDCVSAGPPRPDPGEELELTTVPLDEIPELITGGRITHSLVVSAFHLMRIRSPQL